MTVTETLSEQYAATFPKEAAQALEAVDEQDIADFVAELDPTCGARLLAALSLSLATRVLLAVDFSVSCSLLTSLPASSTTALLRRVPREAAERFLKALPPEDARRTRRMLDSEPNSAGALMDPSVLTVSSNLNIGSAQAAVQKHRSEVRDYIYLTDDQRVLVGVIRAVDLLVHDASTALAEVMTRDPRSLQGDEPTVSVLARTEWRRWRTMPVVDREGHLVGVLRYDVVQSLVETLPESGGSGLSLVLSLAELLWLGAAGVAEGIARRANSGGGDGR